MNREPLLPTRVPDLASRGGSLEPAQAVSAALHHRQLVKGLAWHLVRDAGGAEELEQETWLAALERPPRSAAVIRTWLCTTLRRVRGKRVRSDVRRKEREVASARTEHAPSTEDLVLRIELEQRVVKAVTGLPEPYRTTILLRFYEDLSAREISDRLGVSYTAVRARLWRGLQQLRTALDDTQEGGRAQWRTGLIAACGIDLRVPPTGRPSEPGGLRAAESVPTISEGISLMATPILGAAAIAVCAATAFLLLQNDGTPTSTTVGQTAMRDAPRTARGAPEPAVETFAQDGTTRAAVDPSDIVEHDASSISNVAETHGVPGTLTFRAVDAMTGRPVPAFTARFLSETRFAQNDKQESLLSSMTWDLSIRARGYETVIERGISVLPAEVTDVGEVRLTPGRGVIEGVVRADWSAITSDLAVELQGSTPLEGMTPASGTTPLDEIHDQGGTDASGSDLFFTDETTAFETPSSFGFVTETGVSRQVVNAANQGRFEFRGLPAGDYEIWITNAEAGLFVRHPVVLERGQDDRSAFQALGSTNLDLVLVAEDGTPIDLDRVPQEDWPTVWVEVLVGERRIGSAYFSQEVIYDEFSLESSSESQDETPRSIDRERLVADSLLPPLAFSASHHDFTGERLGNNLYPLAMLPNDLLTLKISSNAGAASVDVDLRHGSPGRLVVRMIQQPPGGR